MLGKDFCAQKRDEMKKSPPIFVLNRMVLSACSVSR